MKLVDLKTDVKDDAERERLCHAFFNRVYSDAFPKADQAESPSVWLPLLRGIPAPPAPILHVIVAVDAGDTGTHGDVFGGIAIEYFRASRVALATYLAVAPGARRLGLGRRLLDRAIEAVRTDNGGAPPLVFAEVERPEAQANEQDHRRATARLAIIAALGGQEVDAPYIQPALGAGQKPLDNLMLVLLQGAGRARSVPSGTIKAFYSEFFASLGQRNSPELTRLLQSLPLGNISLRDLA